jgi:hypothetical protein
MATSTCMTSSLCQQSSIYIDRWNTMHAMCNNARRQAGRRR